MRPRWLVLALAAGTAFTATAQDRMERLAQDSGCTLCHAAWHVDGGVPPRAPAWTDIARRYSGQPGAQDALVKSVMSGVAPGKDHWQGKISGAPMPPNGVEVREPDARALVRWILQQSTAARRSERPPRR
jgi:cytochrome c551/c552